MKNKSNIYTIFTIIAIQFGYSLSAETSKYDPKCEKRFVEPVTTAILFENFEEVKQLIENADNNEIDCIDEDGSTTLIYTARNGYTEIVELLIAAGANVNTAEVDGTTALIWVAYQGHTKIARLLVFAGADVNAKEEEDGWTALIWAAYQGHTEIAELLIVAGADINAAEKDNWTALIFAASEGYTEIVELLIETGCRY